MPSSGDDAKRPRESSREDRRRASLQLEEACDFAGAAREAMLADEPARALYLGALGGDDDVARAAVGALSNGPRGEALSAASDLARRGFLALAGELFELLGEDVHAAEAFARGREARRAAICFERAGRPAEGAKALEAAIRERPHDGSARFALGRLLARHGRIEAAIRTLQAIDAKAPERGLCLPLLARLLLSLGLEDGAHEIREEMIRLGAPAPEAETVADLAREEVFARAAKAPEKGAARLYFGRYEEIREVASTPHARVIEARDRITSDRVALKILATALDGAGRDAFVRFEREARALGGLRHPNVVRMREYVPEGPAIVLDWMGGGSLAERLSKRPVSPARAAEIASAVLVAVGEAHRLGVLHRDIKPANVLFDDAGAAHLSDFGAAHLGDLSRTATAAAIGTLSYMSPEQRMGRPATVASDLYGVGAIFLEMLTGEAPSPARGGQLATPPSAVVDELSAAHDAVVARLLEDDPAARFADAFEARRAIGALTWPERMPERDPRASAAKRASERPPHASGAARLVEPPSSAGEIVCTQTKWDTWTEREVLLVPIDDASLACARGFARADHPALPEVLRVDAEQGQIWIAKTRGEAVALGPRALKTAAIARLREAIALLHEAGGAHGLIDDDHLFVHDGELRLAYPRSAPREGAASRDVAALARLEQASR